MTLQTFRLLIQSSLLLALMFELGTTVTRNACAAGMETVKIAPDQNGFILDPSGDRFVPWGHNYASVDIMERLVNDQERVEREFAEMKAAGTTVARIHPEMPHILDRPLARRIARQAGRAERDRQGHDPQCDLAFLGGPLQRTRPADDRRNIALKYAQAS